MGFSAGAELAAPAAIFFEDFDKKNGGAGEPLAGVSSRPDFVGIVYPRRASPYQTPDGLRGDSPRDSW